MNKETQKYLNLAYTRELIPEPEGGWFVRVKELPGCFSQGDSPDEAIEGIHEAMALWIEAALETGQPIPIPKQDADFSGKFVVRLPKSLHRKAAEQAAVEGVSLNQWIGTVVAEALGQRRSIPVEIPNSKRKESAEI